MANTSTIGTTQSIDTTTRLDTAKPATLVQPAAEQRVIDSLLNYVDYLDTNYMKPWGEGVKKNAAFLKSAANLEVTIASNVKSRDDKTAPIVVKLHAIQGYIDAIFRQFNMEPDQEPSSSSCYLYKGATVDAAAGEAERTKAVQWAKDFGAPDSSVISVRGNDAEGKPVVTWYVKVDTSPLKQLAITFNAIVTKESDAPGAKLTKHKDSNGQDIFYIEEQYYDPSSFATTDSGKTAQIQLIKDAMSVMQQGYSRAQTTSNNVTEMFSACMNKLFDMLRKLLG